MRRTLGVLLLVGLLSVPARAQDGGQDSPLSGSQGVRALGMGAAVSSWLDEPSAIWWNPATLLRTPVRRLELQHTQNAFDTRTEQFALATPTLDHGAWAAAGALQTTSDITITGPSSPTPQGTESFNRFQLGAGYAFGLPKNVDLGFALTVDGYRFMGLQRVAWGLDLGLSPYSQGILRTGVVVKNLLRPTFSFPGGLEDRWARALVGAVGVQKAGFTAGLEVELPERQDTRFRVGGEYQIGTPLAVRAGFDGTGPTAGLSIRYKSFRFDYAFVSPSDLGTEHRFGISIDIGRPIAVQRRLREEQITYEVAQAMDAEKKQEKAALEAQAQSAMQTGEWPEAAAAYARLSTLYPEEPDYATGLKEVTRKRDSSIAAQIDLATREATTSQRIALLDSLARNQMSAGHWSAAVVTTLRLSSLPGHPPDTDSLQKAAADSLAAQTARAVAQAERALADSSLAEAASWARVALLYDSSQSRASHVLAETNRLGQKQSAERTLMEAAMAGDSQKVLQVAAALLSQYPDHAQAKEYERRFAPRGKTVPIETIQADAEAWAWYTRAFSAFREGRFDEAMQEWEKVLTRYPTNEDTRKNLEQARLRLKSDKNR